MNYRKERTLRRILVAISILNAYRYGRTLKQLHDEICDNEMPCCERTVYRDLQLLVSMNLVARIEQGSKLIVVYKFKGWQFASKG